MEVGNEQQKQDDKPKRNDGNLKVRPLNSAESHVAGSPGTGCPGDGCSEAFPAAFDSLVEWGQKNDLIHQESDYECFCRKPDGHGDEHEAWFIEASNRWLKATYPNKFGLAWGRPDSATAREYLTRLVLQNTYFGDDIHLVALLNCASKLRVLTSQPNIEGEPAPYDEITQWFLNYRFIRLFFGDRIAWYRQAENLLVADAHRGNLIKTPIGLLVPIDLNIIQPSGALREWAIDPKSATA